MINPIVSKIEQINNERFKDLNGRRIISLTKMNDFLSEPFDKERVAQQCAEKGATDPKSKYAGMTKEDILAKWTQNAETSMMYGSKVDEYAECVFNANENATLMWKLDSGFDYDEKLQNFCKGLDEFISYMTERGYQFIGREIPMYVESIGTFGKTNIVTGRLDALFYNPEKNKYMVVDWKTTEDIKTQSFRSKRMKGPGLVWEDCDMSKYTIQIHTYKNALINTYCIAPEDSISVCVINLREVQDPYYKKNFIPYKEMFSFDSKRLNDAVDFAINKRELLKKMEEENISV